MNTSKKHIVVIGAGVIGLQTAISLIEAGYEVTIVAEHFPEDRSVHYTSPWAGAHWRTHAPDSDKEQQDWDVETYNHWLKMIDLEERTHAPKSGLAIRDSNYYTADASLPWFADQVREYSRKTETETIFGKPLHCQSFKSVMINAPMYLEYLRDTAKSLGATTISASLPQPSTIAQTLRATSGFVQANSTKATVIAGFVNATGISAKYLVPDDRVYPASGQTVTVKGEARRITTVDAFPDGNSPESPTITYILPRPHSDTTIIGGTRRADDWNTIPNEKTTKEILERAKAFAPELLDESGNFIVQSVQVGLRPSRHGGARVELEEVESMVVCHEYGHAGAGYQNSIGSARKVVRLFNEYFSTRAE